jgi:hypothetical protein
MAKAGRKPKNNEDKCVIISVTVPKELKKKLDQLKEKKIKFNRSSFFSKYVKYYLEKFLELGLDLENREVNKIERALENLKAKMKYYLPYSSPHDLLNGTLEHAAQNLINALEAEKAEKSAMNLIEDTLKDGIKQMEDFNAKRYL